jgi:hypothetical protein
MNDLTYEKEWGRAVGPVAGALILLAAVLLAAGLSEGGEMSVWQQWIQHPEKVWVRKCLFYFHL